jgi:hypothetical protein
VVVVMAGKTRVATRLVRTARLLVGHSSLRRPSDRLEGFIIALLCAAFVAALAAAPSFAQWLYHNQRTAAAQLRPATAVLTQGGPSNGVNTSGATAAARWRAPDGRQLKGVLTTLTAPAISGAPAGTRVQVWLTRSGQPQQPPVTPAGAMLSCAIFTIGAVSGVAVALLLCYWLCRLAIDRRRLAAWAAEWTLTGPKWNTRR